MIAILINSFGIIFASFIGSIIGDKISKKYQDAIIDALQLSVLIIGINTALKGDNLLSVIIALVLGTIVGTKIDIEGKINGLGLKIQKIFLKKQKNDLGQNKFVEAFVTGSLLFCVGSMAIIGPLNSSLLGDNSILISKAILDTVSAFMMSASLGRGMIFSGFSVFLYQGLIYLAANSLKNFFTPAVINNICGVGGLLIIALAFNMLKMKDFKTANMLPSILFAIILGLIF